MISGREEARLIYLGVAHATEAPQQRRLVVDIGGGSTECIVGGGVSSRSRRTASTWDALPFRGSFPRGSYEHASSTRRKPRQPSSCARWCTRYKQLGWDRVLGSSGTVMSVEAILRTNGWSQRGIAAKGLKRLRKAMVAAAHVDGPGSRRDAGGTALSSWRRASPFLPRCLKRLTSSGCSLPTVR